MRVVNVSICMRRPPVPGAEGVKTQEKKPRWTKIGTWCWICGFEPTEEAKEARLIVINGILSDSAAEPDYF